MKKTKLAFVALLAAGLTGIVAAVASAATPQNTSPPTISGTPKVGSTLTANEGTWANAPTSFTYQWQRCASGGGACGDIVAGTAKTYTPTHRRRRPCAARRRHRSERGRSQLRDVRPDRAVSSASGPTNTVRPALSGTAAIGGTLRVSNGSWSPSAELRHAAVAALHGRRNRLREHRGRHGPDLRRAARRRRSPAARARHGAFVVRPDDRRLAQRRPSSPARRRRRPS